MAKYCMNCGHPVEENADVCLNCGVLIHKENVNNNSKVKVPGQGMGIASMVLGIIAAIWTLLTLLAVGNLDLTSSLGYDYTMLEVVAFAIGFTLFSLTPSILGLIFATISLKQHKSGFNLSGIILNSISLFITLIVFTYILFL